MCILFKNVTCSCELSSFWPRRPDHQRPWKHQSSPLFCSLVTALCYNCCNCSSELMSSQYRPACLSNSTQCCHGFSAAGNKGDLEKQRSLPRSAVFPPIVVFTFYTPHVFHSFARFSPHLFVKPPALCSYLKEFTQTTLQTVADIKQSRNPFCYNNNLCLFVYLLDLCPSSCLYLQFTTDFGGRTELGNRPVNFLLADKS